MTDTTHDHLDDEFTADDYHQLADSTDAAKAVAAGDLVIDWSAPPVTLPPPAEGDAMVVRTLRMPLALELRVRALAEARGVPVTTLMREFIADSTTAAEDATGTPRDPVAELHRIADAASRVARVLESGGRAA
jgi:hypothetical protein